MSQWVRESPFVYCDGLVYLPTVQAAILGQAPCAEIHSELYVFILLRERFKSAFEVFLKARQLLLVRLQLVF